MFNFGILGINARNLHYIGKHNPAKAVRLADNKITTKKFLTQRGIPLPATYAIIRNRSELAQFDFSSFPQTNFIIKPARGSRGRGIFRVKKLKEFQPDSSLFTASLSSPSRWNRLFGRPQQHDDADEQDWFEVQGRITSESLLKTYCLDILDGKESLQGRPDHILIEELLLPGDGFETFCTHGLADIRIIVYNFVPVAAMLRVPTKASDGKANLDKGGVGMGVEVGSGKIQSMFLEGKVYTTSFPEPYTTYEGMHISYREDILQRSTQIQYYVNLGYLALDRVITETGPKLLEINARAGLKIQLALDMPLRDRLEKVGDLKVSSPEKGVEICQTLFSKHKTGLISPNKVIPLHGYATLMGLNGLHHEVTVTVDLTKEGVRFDPVLAKIYEELGGSFQVRYFTSEAKISFDVFTVDNNLSAHHVVIGTDMLAGHFVKPVPVMKKHIFLKSAVYENEYDLIRLLDTKIAHINGKLILSRYLKPTNFLQEFDKFLSLQGKYNPLFTYQWPSLKKLTHIQDELAYLYDEFAVQLHLESPVIHLFLEKLEELSGKAKLLVAYRAQDLASLETLQQNYWGGSDEKLLTRANEYLGKVSSSKEELGPVISNSLIKKYTKQFLTARGRGDVEVRFTPETFARMSVKKRGSTLVLQISSGARFRKLELFATLSHELVHLERYMNGQRTDWSILKRGTAKYFIDEEGLAIWTAEQELPEAYEKISMRKKYALVSEAKKYNFMQMGEFILSREERTLMGLFKTIYRLKRGIVDTSLVDHRAICIQDTIYVHGYQRIAEWIAAGNNIQDLKKGKIKIEDLIYFV